MEYKFLTQKSENDCGIAVSTMLINYFHNKNFGIEEIKFNNSLNDEMLSLYDIEKILYKYKIEISSYLCSFEEFEQMQITDPIVLNVLNTNQLEHFIIVYKRRKDNYLIADPNNNDLIWINKDELKRAYQGYLAISKFIEKIDFKNKTIFNWFNFMKDFKLEIFFIFLISMITNILIIISNNFLKVYMENISLNHSNTIKLIFILFISVMIVQLSISYFLNKIIYKIKMKVTNKIYKTYKNNILKLEIEKFNSVNKEEWIKKLSHINVISEFINQTIISIPLEFVLFIMASIFLLIISPFILTIVIIQNLSCFILSLFIFYLLRESKLKREREMINFSSSYRELLDGFEEIKYKRIELEMKKKNFKFFKSSMNESKKIFFISNKSDIAFILINKIFFYLIFYISYFYINKNKFSLADLLFYTSISIYINSFFSNLTSYVLDLQEIIIADKSLKLLFENEDSTNDKLKIIKEVKSIEVNNLYKYVNDNCLLNNFSFNFDKNTFIYGKSGSGKTTLLKLLSSHFNNYEGDIFINGTSEFREADLNIYREKVFYLGQYDYLFSGTVWENMQQFKNSIDLKLLDKLQILEILERNKIDLNKQITDNGNNLSKGQRQIINFISLFFIDRDLLLIDEPLSNVDKHTAYFLFKAFMEYKSNSLVIMCDHDLAYLNFFEKRVEVI
ncbi:ATP-binding cassette domain-containing protein [Spiroplasma diminutum]|uniref:ATP-binding cassette domain-containing protein n=1 Tax=Spiroplasma diminutum TaxID=216936 RepID=UPI0003F5FA5F|nr:cysteine peptidase family C39 domain-containing protein [Spiroplasma diminutum]